MITMHRVDPAKNMAPYYRVAIVRDLFGDFILVRIWGRIGRGGQRLEEWFANRGAAIDARRKLVRLKRRRGYRLVRC